MIARFAGASLGLLAFTVTIAAGLYVRNPVEVVLSRSVLALFVFCLLGLVLGGAAQRVVAEHENEKVSEIRKRYREEPGVRDEVRSEADATAGADEPETEVKSPVRAG